MKGKINGIGQLVIYKHRHYEAATTLEPMYEYSEVFMKCIYNGDVFPKHYESYCGHWCPHFSEPDVVYSDNNKVTRIQICHGKVLYFDEFVDERIKL